MLKWALKIVTIVLFFSGIASYAENIDSLFYQKYVIPNISESITISKEQAIEFSRVSPNSLKEEELLQLALCLYEGHFIKKNILQSTNYLTILSDKNNAIAQCFLAICYLNGDQLEKNRNKALSLLQKSAGKGNSTAEYLLAALYMDSNYSTFNYEKAYSILKKYELEKNPQFAPNLALCYLFGLGTEQDLVKGLMTLEITRHANEESDLYYSTLQCYGLYVEKNEKQGTESLKKMANKGITPAILNLACFYLENNRFEDAITFLLPFAEKNIYPAQTMLANVYKDMPANNTIEETENLKRWKFWLLNAIDNSDEAAKSNLGNLYVGEYLANKNYQDKAMAIFYLEELAKQKLIPAINDLCSLILWDENSLEKDKQHAFSEIERLAEKNNQEAKFIYGMALVKGIGCQQNQSRGIDLVKKEAEAGGKEAMFFLAQCYENGTGVSIDQNLALEWYRKATLAGYPSEDDIERMEKSIKIRSIH